MSPLPLDRLLWWCNAVLRLASWIVPGKQRADWRREWEAEIWHWCHYLSESGRICFLAEQEKVVKHCWGSFVDAIWHRFNREVVLRFVSETPRRPQFCFYACVGLLMVLCAGRPTAFFSDTIAPPPLPNGDRLLTVGLNEQTYWLEPKALLAAADRWPSETNDIDSYSVYAWRPSMVQGPGGLESVLSAKVTADLFTVLGVRVHLGRVFQETDLSECGNCIVLSDVLWRSQFHRDKSVIGRDLRMNGQSAKVIGVLPPEFRFPGHDVSVFSLFGTNPQPMLIRTEWPGALVRLLPGKKGDAEKGELERVINRAGSLPGDARLKVWSLKDLEKESLRSWAGMLGLSLVLLVMLNFWKLARLRETGPRGSIGDDVRWYAFFGVKAALVLVASLMVAVEAAHLIVTKMNSANANAWASAAILWIFLLGAHVSLAWAIKDQLVRCRVCLKGLGMRINLGNTGRILTDLTGAELVCDEGHGTLHVPAMESGSVDSEHWTYLDESWRVLSGNAGTRMPAS